jgi:hypothetical protein
MPTLCALGDLSGLFTHYSMIRNAQQSVCRLRSA